MKKSRGIFLCFLLLVAAALVARAQDISFDPIFDDTIYDPSTADGSNEDGGHGPSNDDSNAPPDDSRRPSGNCSFPIDSCGVCGGNDLIKDCMGICGGLAEIDECGECTRGSSKKVWNEAKDGCGVCYGRNECMGCDGIPNSGMQFDYCGVCGGTNMKCSKVVDVQPSAVLRARPVELFIRGAGFRRLTGASLGDTSYIGIFLGDFRGSATVLNGSTAYISLPPLYDIGTHHLKVFFNGSNSTFDVVVHESELAYSSAKLNIQSVDQRVTFQLKNYTRELNTKLSCAFSHAPGRLVPAVKKPEGEEFTCSVPQATLPGTSIMTVTPNRNFTYLYGNVTLQFVIRAPRVIYAKMSGSMAYFDLYFDSDFSWQSQENVVQCSSLIFDMESIIGDDSRCERLTRRLMRVHLPYGSVFTGGIFRFMKNKVFGARPKNSDSLTGKILVRAPATPSIPVAVIDAPQQIGNCDPLYISGMGSQNPGNGPFEYNWDVRFSYGRGDTRTDANFTYMKEDLPVGAVVESRLHVVSKLGKSSVVIARTLRKEFSIPIVRFAGGSEQTFQPSQDFYVRAEIEPSACEPPNEVYNFTWGFEKPSALFPLSRSAGRTLVIPAGTAKVGQSYDITFEARSTRKVAHFTKSKLKLTAVASPLKGSFGSDEFRVPVSGNFTLVMNVTDPDGPIKPNKLFFTITCTQIPGTNIPCFFLKKGVLTPQPVEISRNGTIQLSADELYFSRRSQYYITVNATYGDRYLVSAIALMPPLNGTAFSGAMFTRKPTTRRSILVMDGRSSGSISDANGVSFWTSSTGWDSVGRPVIVFPNLHHNMSSMVLDAKRLLSDTSYRFLYVTPTKSGPRYAQIQAVEVAPEPINCVVTVHENKKNTRTMFVSIDRCMADPRDAPLLYSFALESVDVNGTGLLGVSTMPTRNSRILLPNVVLFPSNTLVAVAKVQTSRGAVGTFPVPLDQYAMNSMFSYSDVTAGFVRHNNIDDFGVALYALSKLDDYKNLNGSEVKAIMNVFSTNILPYLSSVDTVIEQHICLLDHLAENRSRIASAEDAISSILTDLFLGGSKQFGFQDRSSVSVVRVLRASLEDRLEAKMLTLASLDKISNGLLNFGRLTYGSPKRLFYPMRGNATLAWAFVRNNTKETVPLSVGGTVSVNVARQEKLGFSVVEFNRDVFADIKIGWKGRMVANPLSIHSEGLNITVKSLVTFAVDGSLNNTLIDTVRFQSNGKYARHSTCTCSVNLTCSCPLTDTGMFAFLVHDDNDPQDEATTDATAPSGGGSGGGSSSTGSSSTIWIIVGCVVGGVVVLAAAGFTTFKVIRNRRNRVVLDDNISSSS